MKVRWARFPLIAGAAIAAGAMLAFALPAGASVSVQSQSPPVAAVSLGKKATLDANGAVIFPTVRITCQPGSVASLSVTVTENVGGHIAKGSITQQIGSCTGSTQKFRLAVTPEQRAFRKGVAFGQAQFQVCQVMVACSTAVDEHNIEIVKK